jgi:hypothetical protein
MSRSDRGDFCSMFMSVPSRVRGGVSRMELDRALEAEAERLLDGDVQEAELVAGSVGSDDLPLRPRGAPHDVDFGAGEQGD